MPSRFRCHFLPQDVEIAVVCSDLEIEIGSEPVFRLPSVGNNTPPPVSSHVLAFPEKSMPDFDTINDYLAAHRSSAAQ